MSWESTESLILSGDVHPKALPLWKAWSQPCAVSLRRPRPLLPSLGNGYRWCIQNLVSENVINYWSGYDFLWSDTHNAYLLSILTRWEYFQSFYMLAKLLDKLRQSSLQVSQLNLLGTQKVRPISMDKWILVCLIHQLRPWQKYSQLSTHLINFHQEGKICLCNHIIEYWKTPSGEFLPICFLGFLEVSKTQGDEEKTIFLIHHSSYSRIILLISVFID